MSGKEGTDYRWREDLAAEAALCGACSFSDESGMDLDPSAHTEACQAADVHRIPKDERRAALADQLGPPQRPDPDGLEARPGSFAVVVHLDDGRSLIRRIVHPDHHLDDEEGPCVCQACCAWWSLEDFVDATAERVNAFGQRVVQDSPELPGDRRVNRYDGWQPITPDNAAQALEASGPLNLEPQPEHYGPGDDTPGIDL